MGSSALLTKKRFWPPTNPPSDSLSCAGFWFGSFLARFCCDLHLRSKAKTFKNGSERQLEVPYHVEGREEWWKRKNNRLPVHIKANESRESPEVWLQCRFLWKRH